MKYTCLAANFSRPRVRHLAAPVGVLLLLVGFGTPRPAAGRGGNGLTPEITYSTYLASLELDDIRDVAVDAAGNVYVIGGTFGNDLPVGGGAGEDPDPHGLDGFVAKFAPDAGGEASLIFSTFIGGSRTDFGTGVAVDPDGNVYVAGYTNSPDFPMTVDLREFPDDPGNEAYDAFVVKLSPAGAVIYSTRFGGTYTDGAVAVAVDAGGYAYVTGDTWSADFPTVNPIMTDPGGDYPQDMVVTKLNRAGSAFVYSTYIGGTDTDVGSDIQVDGDGNVYVTGATYSPDFPLTANFVVPPREAQFVLFKIDAAGRRIVYSDGLSYAQAPHLAVDATGAVYVGGAEYPPAEPSGSIAVLSKIDPTGRSIVASNAFMPAAPERSDFITDVAVDRFGHVYVVGRTTSASFPTVDGLRPFQNPDDGTTSDEGFVAKLTGADLQIRFATFLGGKSSDSPTAVAVDEKENVFVVGTTYSTDFPLVSPRQASIPNQAWSHGFVTAISTRTSIPPPVIRGVVELNAGTTRYKLLIEGENFQPGAAVFVGDDVVPWERARLKPRGIVLGPSRAIKERFPGGEPVLIRVVNPDGGIATVSFVR